MGNTSHGVYCTFHILRLYGGGRPRLDTRIFLTRVLHVVRFFYKETKDLQGHYWRTQLNDASVD